MNTTGLTMYQAAVALCPRVFQSLQHTLVILRLYCKFVYVARQALLAFFDPALEPKRPSLH
jgi:hypothetical protein